MTYNNIYEFFKNDKDLLIYFDPQSKALNNEEAAMEIYKKLVDHSKDKRCVFKRVYNIGYVFFEKKSFISRLIGSRNVLISFCVKPEFRTREGLAFFSDAIKAELGNHFDCYLYNKNTRAISFLEKLGMKKVDSNNLITLLTI